MEPWEALRTLLESREAGRIEAFLDGLPWSERARAISRLSSADQEILLTTLAPAEAADLVETLPQPQAADLIELLSPEEAAPIVEELASNEQADLLGELGDREAEAILAEMDPGEAREARELRSHASDSAGGLMVTEYVSLPEQSTVDGALQHLRQNSAQYAEYDVQYLYVTDPNRRPVGVLRTRDLLLASPVTLLGELMQKSLTLVRVDTTLQDLAQQFESHAFFGLPVIDSEGVLCGVVSRNAVDEALVERSDSTYLSSQGIVGGEEFRSHSFGLRTGRRLSWLTVNVVLNLVSASVIAAHQDTLAQVLALSVFLPILSDMSGCAGQQAVAVSIRELTLGLLRPHEFLRVVGKEFGVALINGVVLGAVVGLVAWFWNGNPYLGLVVAGALAINLVVAALVGGVLPLAIKRLGFDPALASGLILTTVTDMLGFFLALSFAAMMLPYL